MAEESTSDDTSPLLVEEGGLRNRKPATKWTLPADWNPSLPYGGKVYLARRKKPDPWWVIAVEIAVIVFTVAFSYYAYYYFDNLHFHITHGYAHLGYAPAQHQVGQRLLRGKGVPKDKHLAMEWFKRAADQGHAHSAYNVAVGHMKGIRTDLLGKGEAHRLIHHAASNGVSEAKRVLNDVCGRGGCD